MTKPTGSGDAAEENMRCHKCRCVSELGHAEWDSMWSPYSRSMVESIQHFFCCACWLGW